MSTPGELKAGALNEFKDALTITNDVVGHVAFFLLLRRAARGFRSSRFATIARAGRLTGGRRSRSRISCCITTLARWSSTR